MKDRHLARRLALQGLCCLDVQGEKAMPAAVDFIHDADEPAAVVEDACNLLRGAWAARDACDALLKAHAKRWDLARLALVDRNILRLGAHELLGLALSPNIVITEAIGLAREFSTAESPRFVNGVLDAIAKEIAKETGKGSGSSEQGAVEDPKGSGGRDQGAVEEPNQP